MLHDVLIHKKDLDNIFNTLAEEYIKIGGSALLIFIWSEEPLFC